VRSILAAERTDGAADGVPTLVLAIASHAFRKAAVEAEGELVQVVVEVLVTDRALVGSHQPALEGERQDPRGSAEKLPFESTRRPFRLRSRDCETSICRWRK
jgi:hypothetical protein